MNGLQQLKTSMGPTSCQSRTGVWGYRRHRPYFSNLIVMSSFSKPLPTLVFTDRKDHTTAVFIFIDRIKKCSWFLGWNSAVRLCFVKGPLNIVWELMFLRIQFKCKYRTKWTISTLHFTSHSQPWTYSVCVFLMHTTICECHLPPVFVWRARFAFFVISNYCCA